MLEQPTSIADAVILDEGIDLDLGPPLRFLSRSGFMNEVVVVGLDLDTFFQ